MKTLRYEYTSPRMPVWDIYCEMGKATHLLVAGTTGSGKSTVLNGMISTAMVTNTPSSIEFIFIDPKMVALRKFRNVSHFCRGYAENDSEALCWLNWAVSEMMHRYSVLRSQGSEDWHGKRTVIVIDELADLMISANAKAIKLAIQKITQLGRAAGISIWAATQAPNRKIIPAEITLNFTDKVALRCISAIESRQIVQVSGAEKLPQYGEAIYLSPRGIRNIKVPMVDKEEAQSIIGYWKENPGWEVGVNWLGREIKKPICA